MDSTKQRYLVLIAILLVVWLSGCHHPRAIRGRENPEFDRRAMSTTIDATDWEYAVRKFVRNMCASGFFSRMRGEPRETVVVDHIKSYDPDLETGFLREMIEKELLNTGEFRIVDEAHRAQFIDQIRKGVALEGMYDPATVPTAGHQLGVQIFVKGDVKQISERGTSGEYRFQYLLRLDVVNVNTAEIIYKDLVRVTKGIE